MFRFLGRVLSSTCFSFGLSSATGSIWYTTRKHKLVPSIFQSATCPFTQNVLFDYYNSAFTKKAEYPRGEKNWFLEIELGRVCPNLQGSPVAAAQLWIILRCSLLSKAAPKLLGSPPHKEQPGTIYISPDPQIFPAQRLESHMFSAMRDLQIMMLANIYAEGSVCFKAYCVRCILETVCSFNLICSSVAAKQTRYLCFEDD